MDKKNKVIVCTGSRCARFGGHAIMAQLMQNAQQNPDYKDVEISETPCIGDCGHAATVLVNDQALTLVQPEDAEDILHQATTSAPTTAPTATTDNTDDTEDVLQMDESAKPKKPELDPDFRSPSKLIGLTADEIMTANNFLGDL